MIKFREHRGSLDDSMETVIELEGKPELVDIVKNCLNGYGHDLLINKETIRIEPYGYDKRINWDTYIITLDGYGVFGFANGEIK